MIGGRTASAAESGLLGRSKMNQIKVRGAGMSQYEFKVWLL